MRRCALVLVALSACQGQTIQDRDLGPSPRPEDGGVTSGADAAGATSDGGDTAADAGALPPPICNQGRRYSPGTTAFVDATERWGLIAAGAVGTRVAIADIDGDGFADLLVRRGGNGSDDFTMGGTRRTWLLRNTGQRGFEDITVRSGLRKTRTSHPDTTGRPGEVVAFGDVDNDGDLDLFTGMTKGVDGALSGETSELLLNDGAGNFTLGPIDTSVRSELDPDAVAGASFLDFDRDGNLDLWVAEGAYTPASGGNLQLLQDRLHKGYGTGLFVDVTADVGIRTEPWSAVATLNEGRAHSRAWSAAACDLNGDGTPELLASSYGRAPNHLWQGARGGDGTVTYANQSVASGYAFDDNQTWQDNEFAKCYCASNRSAQGCAMVAPPRIQCRNNWRHSTDTQAFRLGGNSGTAVCADINNDGALDLLTTEITHWWAGTGSDRSEVLINSQEADVRFDRAGNDAIGLDRMNPSANWDNGDMTAAVLDFDNDGWPDIYIGASDYPGNHGLLFHQSAPMTFTEVSITDGVDHNRSHGVAWADLDRDGDLDLVVGHSRSRCNSGAPNDCYPTRQVRLFENQMSDDSNWIQLDLVGGPQTNRAAIGARVQVSAGTLQQTQEIGGGHGHYGIQNDRVLHFGLGAECEATVTVRWPDADLTTQQFSVPAGYRFRIEQGKDPVVIPRG